MCLHIQSGPHIAKKDFYVLKMAEYVQADRCKSFYKHHIQKYGELLESYLDVYNNEAIEKGFHSIVISDKTRTIMDDYSFDGSGSRRGVILCCIPEGATYYIGDYCDIASNRLQIIEPIVVARDSLLKLKVTTKDLLYTWEALKYAMNLVKESKLNIQPS